MVRRAEIIKRNKRFCGGYSFGKSTNIITQIYKEKIH